MSRAEKIERAKQLRAEGLTYREIGDLLGYSREGARAMVNRPALAARTCACCSQRFVPDHGNARNCPKCMGTAAAENARKRRCEKDTGRARCVDCGDPLSAGSKWKGRQRCVTCHQICIAEPVDRRARQIEAWWAEGLALKEIAKRLGMTIGHLGAEMASLRGKGYSLPYRYTNRKRAGRKFPERVAA